jgi:hypothetical protein
MIEIGNGMRIDIVMNFVVWAKLGQDSELGQFDRTSLVKLGLNRSASIWPMTRRGTWVEGLSLRWDWLILDVLCWCLDICDSIFWYLDVLAIWAWLSFHMLVVGCFGCLMLESCCLLAILACSHGLWYWWLAGIWLLLILRILLDCQLNIHLCSLSHARMLS